MSDKNCSLFKNQIFFQFAEDNLEWSISAGCPVITGGWNVQVHPHK